jgi:TPR repeat protein
MDGILKEVDELRKSGSEMAELTHIQLLVMGFRGEQRISEGMERLSKLAAEGNPNALYLLGCYYLEGVGGPKNPDKAFEFLSQAAEKNHGLANLNLGICYGHGIGVLQDHIKAFQHYLAAASLGDLDAMHNLGNAYLKGNGVPQDLQKAGEWFDRSAKAGNSESMVALALTLLVSGNPSPHQVKRALSLVQKAGDLNNRVAFYVMGKIYQEGPGGIEPDENKAYMYFMKSAQAGVPASQLQVALTLRFGTLEGLPADKIEALKWAMLADLGGEPEASKVIRALRSTLPESDIARAESRAALFTPVDMDISLRGKVRFNSPPRSSP